MSRSNFDDVGDFHEKFNLDSVTHHGAGIRFVPPDLLRFRIEFLREELREFEEAADAGDTAKMFDALLDLTYVAMGTAHLHGFPWQVGWDEVQRANMSKERAHAAGDSKRGSTWDVVKPDGWKPPDIEGIVDAYTDKCQQCQRTVIIGAVKEILTTIGTTQYVTGHCVCGATLYNRLV